MKSYILIFLLILISSLASAQPGVDQTDWSGGPGVTGPIDWFSDTFSTLPT